MRLFTQIDVPELTDRDEQVAKVVEENPELLHERDGDGRTIAHIAVGRGCKKLLSVISSLRPSLLAATDYIGGLPEQESGPPHLRDQARQLREGERAQQQAENLFA